jgi:hypothetical protein
VSLGSLCRHASPTRSPSTTCWKRARIYAISLDAAAAAGFVVPADSAATELGFLRRMQSVADRGVEHRPADPVEAFLRRCCKRR